MCLWFVEEHPLSLFFLHICYVLCWSIPLVTWARTVRCVISTKLTDLILISAVLDGTQIFTWCMCGKVSGKHQQPKQDFSRILSRIYYLTSRIPSRQKSRIRLYVVHYPPIPTGYEKPKSLSSHTSPLYKKISKKVGGRQARGEGVSIARKPSECCACLSFSVLVCGPLVGMPLKSGGISGYFEDVNYQKFQVGSDPQDPRRRAPRTPVHPPFQGLDSGSAPDDLQQPP